MEKIAVLGSTGSIGKNTLEVAARLSHRFQVVGLAAGANIGCLEKQIERFWPKIVSVEDPEDAERLRKKYRDRPLEIVFGQRGAEEVARFSENTVVVSAITGIDGLRSTLAAAQTGKKVALANKESMVVAGQLIKEAVASSGGRIVPVDSEHSGVFQCLAGENRENIKKVILTASGGPFWNSPLEEIKAKTLAEALNHPRWKMGDKVTIDSATMMNKGLELIEARWLFDLKPEQLSILVHPQSIVHSLVEMRDGSVLAQLSPTDMKVPIQYALTYPEREEAPVSSLDLSRVKTLEFFELDKAKFPLVAVARRALEEGGSLPVVLNAANEVCVTAFLQEKIAFFDIADTVAAVANSHERQELGSLEDILDLDCETRKITQDYLKKRM